jgi:hypothetical protein
VESDHVSFHILKSVTHCGRQLLVSRVHAIECSLCLLNGHCNASWDQEIKAMSTGVDEILPIELFEQIIAFLSKFDLASLSRVNRKFNLVSQSTLYHSVFITNLRAGIICLRSTCRRQELALAVRQFTLHPDAEDYVDSLSLQGLLRRSIKAMSNLVELRIPVPPQRYDEEDWPVPTAFDYPPRIIHYASHHLTICDFSGLPHHGIRGEWFVDRPHIVELHIGEHLGIDKIESSVLPRLQRVISPAADKAALLIPGRPVTFLYIHLDAVYSFGSYDPLPIFDSTVLPPLSKGSVPLKAFECSCDRFALADFIHFFASLSLHLPTLETMRIKIESTLIDISGVLQVRFRQIFYPKVLASSPLYIRQLRLL